MNNENDKPKRPELRVPVVFPSEEAAEMALVALNNQQAFYAGELGVAVPPANGQARAAVHDGLNTARQRGKSERLKKVYEDCWGLFVENDEGEPDLCLVPGTGVAAVYSQAYSMVPAQIATERNRDAAGTGFNWSARRVRVTVEEV